jgi:hypothetical protein
MRIDAMARPCRRCCPMARGTPSRPDIYAQAIPMPGRLRPGKSRRSLAMVSPYTGRHYRAGARSRRRPNRARTAGARTR